MKMKIIALLIAVGGGANAASITLSSAAFVNDTNNVAIPDNTGVVAIGMYAGGDPVFSVNPTKTEVLSGFTQLGGDNGFADSLGGLDGYFNFVLDATVTSAFNNNTIYFVLGNALDLNSSDEMLVWKATSNPDGNLFVEDNPTGGPGSVVLNNANGSVLLGDFGVSTASRFTLAVVVPEPSSTALLGLGGLALFLRRRR